MDPLSMTSSILAIRELTATLISSLNGVKNTTEEQAQVMVEARNLEILLIRLNFCVEAARPSDPWFNQVKLLGRPNGPLDQFKEVLEMMLGYIPGSTQRDQIKSALIWKFTKTQVEDALQRMERLKTLLHYALNGDSLTLTRAIHNDIRNPGMQLAQLNIRTSQLQPHVDQQLQEWLGIPDPSTNYQAALRRRHPDTGLWLINGRPFEEWKDSESSLMWLHGIAGCGKTILSATVLQEIRQLRDSQPDTAIGYFYFDFKDTDKQSSKKAIRSLLWQVASHTSHGQQSVKQLYQRCENGQQQPPDDAIQLLFRDILVSPHSVYIILDALDECADQTEILQFLCSLIELKLPGLRVFVTSRRERDIEEQLQPILTYAIDIQSPIVDGDIHLYVQSQLTADRKLSKWPHAVRDEISSELMEKAHGMFRWVHCQLESIRSAVTLRTLREVLSSLPKTLDETYERILQDLQSRGLLQDAIKVLQWLCFSERPLLLSELVEVLAIEGGNSGGFHSEKRLLQPMDVLTLCSDFVTCNTIGEDFAGIGPTQVQLAHWSVKSYLLSKRCTLATVFSADVCHQQIAEGCMHYLMFLAKHQPLTSTTIQEYPLAAYSAEFWWQHVRKVDETAESTHLILATKMLIEQSNLSTWIQLYDPDARQQDEEFSIIAAETTQSLYYAARIGSPNLVRKVLLHSENDISHRGRYGTALEAAVRMGDEALVRLLLAHGADVNAQGGDLYHPLHVAARRGHEEIVRLLLDHGTNVNAQGGDSSSPLQRAVAGGHHEVVQMLLQSGANVDPWEGGYDDPLHLASEVGDIEVVRLLLRAGADVNAQGGIYGNALQAASQGGHVELVQLLSDMGADVNAQGGMYGNALQAASQRGQVELVQLLSDMGADVNAQGGLYGNALKAASYNGHEGVVQELLSKGAQYGVHSKMAGSDREVSSQLSTLVGTLETSSKVEAARDFLSLLFCQDNRLKPVLAAISVFSTIGQERLSTVLTHHFRVFAREIREEFDANKVKSHKEACNIIKHHSRSLAHDVAQSCRPQRETEVFVTLHAQSPVSGQDDMLRRFLDKQSAELDTASDAETSQIPLTSTSYQTAPHEEPKMDEDGDSDAGSATSAQLDQHLLILDGLKVLFEPSRSFTKLVDNLWHSIEPDLFDWWSINTLWQKELGESAPNWLRDSTAGDVRQLGEEHIELSDKVKLILERFTSQPWDWAPFTPPKRPIPTGKIRLSFHACCGRLQRFDVTPLLAEKIRRFIQVPVESRKWLDRPCNSSMTPQQSGMSQNSRPTHNPNESQQGSSWSRQPTSNSASLSLSKLPSGALQASSSTPGSQSNVQSTRSTTRFILICVRNMSGPNSLRHDQIEIPEGTTDNQFFKEFRAQYRRLRGWYYWFHVDKFWFCHCSRYYKWDSDKISWEQHEMPRDGTYTFIPTPPAVPYSIPISRDEWEHRLQDDCSRPTSDFLIRVPKRDNRFEISTCVQAHQVWGLHVEYRTSARVVLAWSFLIMSPGIVFCIQWLLRFPNDLQNAMMPLALLPAMVGLPIGLVTLGGQFRATRPG